MRKLALAVALVAAAALAWPAGATAQQQDGPPSLRLSFMICDWSAVGDLMAEADSVEIPVWEELKSEGLILDHGYFVHAWADEWNVAVYTVGTDVTQIIEAVEEANRRLGERYPNLPNPFDEACPQHRDAFYTMGPNTMDGGSESGEM